MVKPLLDGHRTGCQPSSMQTGTFGAHTMVVMVSMAVAVCVFQQLRRSGRVEEEVRIERGAAVHAHEEATKQKHARHAQRSQALDLAEAEGEVFGWRAQAPRDCRERQNVRGEIGQAVPGVGDHGLRVEGVAAQPFGDGHAQIGVKADPGDAHTGVGLVSRGQVDIVVVMVVMTEAVGVAGVASRLGGRGHDCCPRCCCCPPPWS